jgi:hypothetical protein
LSVHRGGRGFGHVCRNSGHAGDGASASANVYLDIIAGQSNAIGVLTPDVGDVDIAGVYQFVGYSGDANYRTIQSDITPLLWKVEFANTLGPHLARAAQALTDEPTAKILMVPVAQSTTGLVNSASHAWQAGSPGGTLFENMIDMAGRAYTAAVSAFPGTTIIPRLFWQQGEGDTGGTVSTAQYVTGLTDLISTTRSRLSAIPGSATMKVIIGSMLPSRWFPTANAFNQGYADINAAHVNVSLNVSNVYYVMGPNVVSPDNIHYQPNSAMRTIGVSMQTVLNDVVGPTMTSPSSMGAETSGKLALLLTGSDNHQTFHLNGGADVAQFEISDPYLAPTLRWVSDGTSPGNGTYVVKVRARDGRGNYGADQTVTITVAAEVSPASFFTSGERGAAWDLSTLSNLSQTIDGLTPVTATGQSVGWVRDISGNNNHWIAAGNNTTRPTYQTDSDGKPYLSFDGSNDILFSATPLNSATDGRYTAVVGLFAAAPASNRYVVGSYSTSTTTPFVEAIVSDTSGGAFPSFRNDASSGGGQTTCTIASMFDNTNKRVINSGWSGSGGTCRLRNAPGRPSGGGTGNYTSIAIGAFAQNFTVTRGALGGRGFNAPANWWAGRIYSGGFINRYMSDLEIKNFENWAANRCVTSALP